MTAFNKNHKHDIFVGIYAVVVSVAYVFILLMEGGAFRNGENGTLVPSVFAGSWPFVICEMIPVMRDHLKAFLFGVACMASWWYWRKLLRYILQGRRFLLIGVIFHMSGGCILAFLYKKMAVGIPELCFLQESVWGAALVCTYMVSYYIVCMAQKRLYLNGIVTFWILLLAYEYANFF